MKKERKYWSFVILEFLVQYYFAFGALDKEYWWKATAFLLIFYFGANISEGIWGKEKTNTGDKKDDNTKVNIA